MRIWFIIQSSWPHLSVSMYGKQNASPNIHLARIVLKSECRQSHQSSWMSSLEQKQQVLYIIICYKYIYTKFIILVQCPFKQPFHGADFSLDIILSPGSLCVFTLVGTSDTGQEHQTGTSKWKPFINTKDAL